MRKHFWIIAGIFISTFVFGSSAYADIAILTPVAGQTFSEGDVLWVHWSGNLGSYAYGYNASSANTLNISISPNTYASKAFDIGAADASSTDAFKWIVPKGLVSYFGGASQFQIVISGNNQTYRGPIFNINGATSTPPVTVKKVFQSTDMQCRASSLKVDLGKPVTYFAITNIGTGAYYYRWSGSVPNLNSSTTSVIYPSLGTYKTSLNVIDRNYDTWFANCPDVEVVYPSTIIGSSASSTSTNSTNGNFQVNANGVYTSSGSGASSSYVPTAYTYNPNSTWVYNSSVQASSSVWTWTASSSSATTTSTSSATSTASCTDLKQDLYVGIEDTSADVASLQTYLSAVGDFSYSPTGFFGVRTQAAVKKFQAANNINQTGYAGPLTRAKIKSLTCTAK